MKLENLQTKFGLEAHGEEVAAGREASTKVSALIACQLIFKAFQKAKTKEDLLEAIDVVLKAMPKNKDGKCVDASLYWPPSLTDAVDKAKVYEAALRPL